MRVWGQVWVLLVSTGHVAGQLPQAVTNVPPQCDVFVSCTSLTGVDWNGFRTQLQRAHSGEAAAPLLSMEVYFQLMEAYALDAGTALECRMGVATVFYRLGHQYLQMGYAQRAANLFQLAMSMFWDVSRAQHGMDCLQLDLWGVKWFDEFMETYLQHAARLRRNDLSMLPYPGHWQVPADYRNPSLRIAVFSLCDYSVESSMHWLLTRSQQNRHAYCQRHGYGNEWTSQRPALSQNRHPVWGQIAGPLELMEQMESRYDWVMSMDCDSMFVNMDVTIDFLLYRFAARETPWGKLELDPDVHFLISEDGRGLAGGNWIVRNSPGGRSFLREVYGPDDEKQNPYMRHDLRDQFSLLWHLVRPGVSAPLPAEPVVTHPTSPQTWQEIGYLAGVRLIPQNFLLGSYPYVSCSQPGDMAHRCFAAPHDGNNGKDGLDFIVSIPLLGSLPQDMAQAMLDRFLLEGLGTLGQPAYDAQLRSLCQHVDISRCLVGNRPTGALG